MPSLVSFIAILFGINNIKAGTIEASVDLSIYGVLSESCEFDETNNKLYVQRRDAPPNGIASITSDVSKLMNNDTEYSFPIAEGSAQNGMVLLNNKLYVANYAGNFTVYNIQNGNILYNEFIAVGINGLCNDPDNSMIFYTAAVGIDFASSFQYDNTQGLWKIDTSVTPYNITQVLDSNTMVNGGPVFPNGCIVSNNIVYMVETRLDFTGSIVKYNINDNTFSLDGIGIGSGDGIVTDGNGKFWMSQWGSFDPSAVAGSIVQFEVVNGNITNIETIVSQGLVSPADICMDVTNGIIYAPSLQTGYLYAIQLNITGSSITTTSADITTTLMDSSSTICSTQFYIVIQILIFSMIIFV